MTERKNGKIIKGLGGLFSVRVTEADGSVSIYTCPAKGGLKRDEERLLIGDNVTLTVDTGEQGGTVIDAVAERKNALIRPPMANLDYLFLVFAAKKPSPVIEVVDKLSAIAVHNGIAPVIVITKQDLSGSLAEEYARIYRTAGFDTFITSSESGEGIAALSKFIRERVSGGATAAFAGASGVGKSTLMNALFEGLRLSTSEISKKIERGRHTTRHVEIFDTEGGGFLADTPGFSLIDFARFDFFSLDELGAAFPDILPYAHGCRYSDCAHVGEGASECAVARAAEEGKIAPSRLESYRSVYRILKNKTSY
ncbi:MAG: ribosome small subunit-dependent GTPase A [Clostridia bacterium]|nr:ribosome small subunit-dependent GTPase A [Clostridia bacterium]